MIEIILETAETVLRTVLISVLRISETIFGRAFGWASGGALIMVLESPQNSQTARHELAKLWINLRRILYNSLLASLGDDLILNIHDNLWGIIVVGDTRNNLYEIIEDSIEESSK